MEFCQAGQPEATAIIDARSGKASSYADLRRDAAAIAAALPRLGRKSLGLLLAQNRYECLAAYMAALESDSAVILLDASLNASLLQVFLDLYRPDWIFTAQPEIEFARYRGRAAGVLENAAPEDLQLHPELTLLLNTSGSTGSPKLVRLTRANLAANAGSIAEYLHLTPAERPITSLPMAYSYGLSVINSHWHAGASIVLTGDGVLRREFWEAVDRYGCTSFAGVPYTYQMLLQTGLLKSKGGSLKTLTQAGGRLDERYVRQMYDLAADRGWKFVVMYGQTEASPRISYVPFERLGQKVGSIGVAIPGGSLTVEAGTGELIYRGPNVMMGYAERREDLAKGDELKGELRTGDLARQDADQYFYITGRLKRFLKLFGKRFNLDEVESIAGRRAEAAVACFGRDDLLMLAVENSPDPDAIGAALCETLDLPRAAVRVIPMKELPRTANGKPDYRRLAETYPERTLAATR